MINKIKEWVDKNGRPKIIYLGKGCNEDIMISCLKICRVIVCEDLEPNKMIFARFYTITSCYRFAKLD